MITDDMKVAIENKRSLVKNLNTKLNKIIEVELDLKTRERNILNKTNWNELFQTTNRVTDKQKTAHIDDLLKKDQEKLARLKNEVVVIKNDIQLCNDEISLCKYIIKEKELESSF